VLEVVGLVRTYGAVRALDGMTFAVEPGSVTGFLGPNGAGKTTTMRAVFGLTALDAGEVRWDGRRIDPLARRRFGYLPEERGLYRQMTVRDVLRFFAALKGRHDARKDIDDWLERLDLAAHAGKKVAALSKGMSQKVQFIATVVARPTLVLLDEPFSGLDPVNAEVLREAVLDLRRGGTTVIFSTHDMGVAEKMCDFIFMIYRGRKVLDGTLEAIQDAHGSDTIRVRLEGNGASLTALPGVAEISDFGKLQELHLAPGADAQRILAALMGHGRVRHFELTRPSLHEIFVRIARPEAEGDGHA
jgi:ABC-2 type transport system ATP-binding protein